MLVIVTGSRKLENKIRVRRKLNESLRESVKRGEVLQIAVGDCPTGADKFVRDWAYEYKNDIRVRCRVFSADWDKYGRKAGPIRNAFMVDEALMFSRVANLEAVCLAFPRDDEKNAGTHHCATTAGAKGISVEYHWGM
ncbi:SLOG family protein [Nocardiopsis sp. NPDC049922]|uniref:SLOG family protein n=1 Tax=Nocardiopsis sp. NPDC049922 TaxID=3155157 RepID=UPI0033E09153